VVHEALKQRGKDLKEIKKRRKKLSELSTKTRTNIGENRRKSKERS